LTDELFEKQFANATLPKQLFDHEAHLRLAWVHIQKYDLDKAIFNITIQLQRYVAKLGAEDKYNHTLTIAAIKAVNHFVSKSSIDNFHDFMATYPRLKHNFKEILEQHYGFDVFNSAKAKSQYLEPDLLAFS
jgi:hypothetical protein